jgi:hypothetical protein
VVVGPQQLWVRVVRVEESGYSFSSTVDYAKRHPVGAITEDLIYPPLYFRRGLIWVWITSAHVLLIQGYPLSYGDGSTIGAVMEIPEVVKVGVFDHYYVGGEGDSEGAWVRYGVDVADTGPSREAATHWSNMRGGKGQRLGSKILCVRALACLRVLRGYWQGASPRRWGLV